MSKANGQLLWRKSTACGSGACVAVAIDQDAVHVRDSKDPAGPTLTFTRDEWSRFLAALKTGVYDR